MHCICCCSCVIYLHEARRSPHCTTISDSFVYLCDNKTTRQPPRGMGKCRIYTYITTNDDRRQPKIKKQVHRVHLSACGFCCCRRRYIDIECFAVLFILKFTWPKFSYALSWFSYVWCVCGVFVRSCNVCDKKLMFPDGMKRRRQRVYCEKNECAHQILSARTFFRAHSPQHTVDPPITTDIV